MQPYPSGAGKWQISTRGGNFPMWRGDGRELFYVARTAAGKLMAVEVKASGSTFEMRRITELTDSGVGNFTGGGGGMHPYTMYAVSSDGQRFLVARPVPRDGDGGPAPIAVVVNWAEGLKK